MNKNDILELVVEQPDKTKRGNQRKELNNLLNIPTCRRTNWQKRNINRLTNLLETPL